AVAEQPREEVVEGVVGEAALWHRRRAAAGGPLAELEAELARDQLGVLEEHLVEGADAKEEDYAGVGVAELEILADELAVAGVGAGASGDHGRLRREARGKRQEARGDEGGQDGQDGQRTGGGQLGRSAQAPALLV